VQEFGNDKTLGTINIALQFVGGVSTLARRLELRTHHNGRQLKHYFGVETEAFGGFRLCTPLIRTQRSKWCRRRARIAFLTLQEISPIRTPIIRDRFFNLFHSWEEITGAFVSATTCTKVTKLHTS